MLHVLCGRPGMNRGGINHPAAHAVYPQDAFTPAELRDLIADPLFKVVVGEVLTEDHVAEMEAAEVAPKAKGRK